MMRMKNVMNVKNLVLCLAVLLLVTFATGCDGDGRAQDGEAFLTFTAELSGAQEVTDPPGGVDTDTTGNIRIEFDEALTEAEFRLEVFGGVGITQAHFHCGPAGVNGPVVVFLFPLGGPGPVDPPVDVDGVLDEGVLTNANIIEGVDCVSVIGTPVNNIASLAFAARNGLIYANVHTVANPDGEVRGQLFEE